VNIWILLGIVLLAATRPAAAQNGSVAGHVADQTGRVLPGVTIELADAAGEHTAVTNHAGAFQFDRVTPGRVELTYRLINFTVLRKTVMVAEGPVTAADAVLTLSLHADVVVTGASTFRNIADVPNPAENLVGIAGSSSQGAITAAQLETRPVMRAGEVLETVPGLVISQHSGEGKANQYYLRGFNLDHGTDFSTNVVGIPVNTPTGAHAHGYADVGFLIPELVSGVQFKKGPYFADEGDFSAAGSASISYVNQLASPMVHVSGGGQGWRRFLGAASPRVVNGRLLAALDVSHTDGPWERPDDFQKTNALLRYSRGTAQNGFSLTGLGYWADWRSTDQVPQRAIDSGAIGRFSLIDPSDRGQENRQMLVADWQRGSGPSSLRATAYAQRNSLNLFSNFTYFLDHPDEGDQFEQAERRVTAGGRLTYRRLGHCLERHTESSAGVQIRRDWLDPVGLYHTASARRLSTTREDQVGQTMLGLFAQTEIEWTPRVRATLGLRGDVYQFDVTSDNALNSGRGTSGIVSPKLGVVFGPWAGTEWYVNAGTGYHSNDARGAAISVDPSTGGAVDRVTPLVRAKGAEVGVRTVRVKGLQSTVSAWYLSLDSELLFVGDAGTTEAGRPSRRVGVEWTNYARLTPWMTVDADLAFSRARFIGSDPAGDFIPGALDRVISAGVSVEPKKAVFGSLRLRHFGPRPLIEDESVQSKATTLWNGEIGYRFSNTMRLVLEGYNLFDSKVSDVDYFYTSRLPGEPGEGVEDLHTHPAIPRTARLSLQVKF
jgi:outer membrane receptor protein involved in Fe transport